MLIFWFEQKKNNAGVTVMTSNWTVSHTSTILLKNYAFDIDMDLRWASAV